MHLTSTMVYDFDSGHLEEVTGPTGLMTTYSYNSAGLPSGSTMPTGATTSAAYNAWGAPTSSTTSYDDGGTTRNLTVSAIYNGFGQVIQEVNVHGGQVNTTYDAMGRVATVTNPFTSGGTPSTDITEYEYDTLGRVTVVTLPDGDTVETEYSGLTVTVTDQVNRQIKREMDSLGRLVKVYEQDVTNGNLTQETSYTYNLMDRLIEVDQGDQLRKFKYDDLGRLIYERIPEQEATINDGTGTYWTQKYTYTDFHAIATRTDARGVITTYTYDTLNRLTEIDYNVSGASGVATTASVEFAYDNDDESATFGKLLSVTSGGATEEYSYDGSKRLSAVERTIGSQSYTTSYEYNEASQVTKLTYPSSYYFYVDHDTKGRVLRLTPTAGSDTGSYVKSVGYNIAGQVTGMTLGNGGVESYGYDAERLQMTSQTAVKNTTTLLSLTYDYEAASNESGYGTTAGNSGQLMGVTGTIGGTGFGGSGGVGGSGTESAAYTYDNLGRLVTSNQTTNSTTAARRFAYDRWGNRTGVWNATSGGTQIQSVALEQVSSLPTNRIASVTTNGGSPVDYEYDEAGNVIDDGAHTYEYDAENRVVSVDSGTTAEYEYDHQNRRVKKTVGSAVTHYVWQGGQVLAEHNGATGALLINYTYSGSRLLMKTESGTTRYLLSDRLSTRLVLDTSGSIVGRQATLPFGEELNTTGTPDKRWFTSYERDTETSNDYAVNRGYGASVGRFNQVDPVAQLETPQAMNRYSYALNDPINRLDPDGRESFWGGFGPGWWEGWWFPGEFFDFLDPFIQRRQRREEEKPTSSCKVTLKFKVVPPTGSSATEEEEPAAPYYHAYILLEESVTYKEKTFDLPRQLFRGGPTNQIPIFHLDGWGDILVQTEVYRPGGIDYQELGDPEHKHVQVGVFAGTCARLKASMDASLSRINNRGIPYAPQGPNSNSVVYTLLFDAGLLTGFNHQLIWDEIGEPSNLPGWGRILR